MHWAPANPVEERMHEALTRGDSTDYFRIVATAPLFLPATETDVASEGGAEQAPRLFTIDVDGERGLLVFTSPAAARAVSGADSVLTIGYRELLRKWPDPSWRLALDPSSPIGAFVPIDTVVRAALGEVVAATVPQGALLERHVPANPTERGLQVALVEDDPDLLMDVLVTATVCVPTTSPIPPHLAFGPDFDWWRVGGVIAVFTSRELVDTELGVPNASVVEVPFLDLVRSWPAQEPLIVNPGSAIEVLVSAERIGAFLDWAAGLPGRYRQ